ncbi:MAG: bifunctional alpha,alpha-trehalose-phosphate synthase (UDP-forming)/trehalose-phosphatase, partial [Acidobacteria bacterium]
MEHWFGNLSIQLHAEHGFWSRLQPERSWEAAREESSDWKQKVLPLLEQFAAATPGSLIEEKAAAIAWHYRMADLEFGTLQAETLSLRLKKELDGMPVEVLPGDKVIEVRLQGIHKGIIVPR